MGQTCLCKTEPSIVMITERKYDVGNKCWRKMIRKMPHWDNTTTSVDIKKAIGLIE